MSLFATEQISSGSALRDLVFAGDDLAEDAREELFFEPLDFSSLN